MDLTTSRWTLQFSGKMAAAGVYTAGSAGIRLISNASMIHAQPLKSISSPTNRPITHGTPAASAGK